MASVGRVGHRTGRWLPRVREEENSAEDDEIEKW